MFYQVKTKEVDVGKDIPTAKDSRKVSTLYMRPTQGSDFRRRPRKFEHFAKLEDDDDENNAVEEKKKPPVDEKTGQMVLREVQTESGTYVQHQKLPRLRLEHRYPPKPHKITKEHYVDQPTKLFNVEDGRLTSPNDDVTKLTSPKDENSSSGVGDNTASSKQTSVKAGDVNSGNAGHADKGGSDGAKTGAGAAGALKDKDGNSRPSGGAGDDDDDKENNAKQPNKISDEDLVKKLTSGDPEGLTQADLDKLGPLLTESQRRFIAFELKQYEAEKYRARATKKPDDKDNSKRGSFGGGVGRERRLEAQLKREQSRIQRNERAKKIYTASSSVKISAYKIKPSKSSNHQNSVYNWSYPSIYHPVSRGPRTSGHNRTDPGGRRAEDDSFADSEASRRGTVNNRRSVTSPGKLHYK